MTREFSVTGPIEVRATLRSADLLITPGEPGVVTVLLESSRDAAERGAFAANSVVELVGDVLYIDAQLPRFFARGRSRIHVTLPTGCALHAETGSGDVTCLTALPRATVRTGSGDIELTEVDELRYAAGSGDLRMASVRTARAQSGSGDLRIQRVLESLSSRTGSGDLVLGTATDVEAASGSGDISIEELHGASTLRSASGDVTVRRAVSGRLETRTASGDVHVGVASGTAALLDCSTVSGRLRSELAGSEAPGPDEARLELIARTTSGNLTISRAG
ncbi:MAG TPA: DUF4097 family beta strand repeat-containing protein [Actinomycetaceae bacterium]|nr:DUF4097 family beta strand repeat-containing protein [Actinomycetaceae bacterium]